jgi:hypothetical protein
MQRSDSLSALVTLQALFEGGPPSAVQNRLRLLKPGQRCIVRRILLVILVAWLPLLVTGGESFSSDLGAHARYLIAVPLLMLAEAVCAPQLGAIARHFLESRLVADEDRTRFDAAVRSTQRLRDAWLAEVMVVVLAYASTALLIYTVSDRALPPWHATAEGGFTFAGWWNALVSLPIMTTLLLGWLWRLVLWARFLWRVSWLNLQLIAAHPDRAGGLCFVGQSVRAFSILAFAISVIVMGSVADDLIYRGASLLAYKSTLGVLAVVNIALFTAPLFVFTGQLLRARRRGLFTYGALALALGRELERAWIGRREAAGEDALETQAFSATTDLYQVVANVYQMRFVPMEWQSVAVLMVATLLPAVVVVLGSMPMDVVVARLIKLVL